MYLNKKSVIEAIRKRRVVIDKIFPPLLGDRDVALELVKYRGTYLGSIDRKYRDDFEIAVEAVRRDIKALQFVSERLKKDKEFALELVKCKLGFIYLNDEFTNDFDVIMMAVTYAPEALSIASLELRGNKDIVLTALRNDKNNSSSVLTYASQELCNDKEVVLEAIKIKGSAIMCASIRLHNDRDVILEVLKHGDEELIKYVEANAGSDVLEDPEIALIIIRNKKRELLIAQKATLEEIERIKGTYNKLLEEQRSIEDEIKKCDDFMNGGGRK